MGNNSSSSSSSFNLCKKCFVISCCTKQIVQNHKAIQVVKLDGKVLTFTNKNCPILVKDVLAKLSKDICIGIGLSKEFASTLPLDYELKGGKVYYVHKFNHNYNNSNIKNDVIDHENELKSGANCKRVKIVITRQQLNELLAKQISVEKVMLLELEKQKIKKSKNMKRVFSNVITKSSLESIPEDVEF